MRKIILTLSVIALLIPISSRAFESKYTNVVKINGNVATLKSAATGTDQYYSCPIATPSNCSLTAAPTPSLPQFKDDVFGVSPDGKILLAQETITVKTKNKKGKITASQKTVYNIYSVKNSTAKLKKNINIAGQAVQILVSNNAIAAVLIQENKISVYDLNKNKKLAQIAAPAENSFYLTLSPLGKYLAFYTQIHFIQGHRYFNVVETKTGKSIQWGEETPIRDLVAQAPWVFAFAPDDSKLAYLNDTTGFTNVYSLDLKKFSAIVNDGVNPGQILPGQNGSTVNSIAFGTAANLFYTINSADSPTAWSLFAYDYKTAAPTKVSDNVSWSTGLNKIDNYIAFQTVSNQAGTADLADVNSDQVINFQTNAGQPQIGIGQQVKLQHGYSTIFKPDNFDPTKTYPLIVWLHGGPIQQTALGYNGHPVYGRYDVLTEALRQSGFIVLKVDYSGSFGYGKDFFNQLVHGVGVTDVAAVTEAVQNIKSQVNISQAYTMGISYGGYLALKSVVEHPEMFSGTIAISAVTDWATTFGDPSDVSTIYFDGYPNAGNQSYYDQASIINKIQNFSGKKIFITDGNQDDRVSNAQTQLFTDALNKLSIPFTSITYPGEGHVYTQPANLNDLCQKVLTFVGAAGVPAICQ